MCGCPRCFEIVAARGDLLYCVAMNLRAKWTPLGALVPGAWAVPGLVGSDLSGEDFLRAGIIADVTDRICLVAVTPRGYCDH